MAVPRPLLAGLALLLMVGPVHAQERLKVQVEVDLVPHPESGAFNLFLVGTDAVDSQGLPIWSKSPDDIQRVGLWLQSWPAQRELELLSGLHYRAVLGTRDHPQPFDTASPDLLFEGQPGPLHFELAAEEPTLPESTLESGEAPVQLRIELGSLRSDDATLSLMVFDALSLRDGWIRRDAMPLEIIELSGEIEDGIFTTELSLTASHVYVPSLSRADAGLLSDILGNPAQYTGGPDLALRFGPATEDASPAPPLSPGTVAVTGPPAPAEETDSSTQVLAAIIGGLGLVAVIGTARARRKS